MTAYNPPDQSMLALVNNAISELHRRLGLLDAEFFCECGSSSCKERIRLPRADYANARRASEPVIVAAHARSHTIAPDAGMAASSGAEA